MTILVEKPGNPCYGKKCIMPEASFEKYGVGTIAACERCGRQARLGHDSQMEGGGPIWIWLLPEDYVKTEALLESESRG